MFEERKYIDDFINGMPDNYIETLIVRIVNFNGWGQGFEKQDVLQKIRIALLTNFKEDRYRGEGLIAYVTKIAEKQCLMEVRRLQSLRKRIDICPEPGSEVPDPQPSIVDEIIAKEKRDLALKILSGLDKRCRKLLIFKFYKGFSYEEISRRLSITSNNAMVSVYRCLEKCQGLRQKMEKTL